MSKPLSLAALGLAVHLPTVVFAAQPPPPPPPPVLEIQFSADGASDNSLGLGTASGTDEERLFLRFHATSVDDLYGVAFDLRYPWRLLAYEGVSEGSFLSQDRVETNLQVLPLRRRIVVGLTRTGDVVGRQLGSGTVLTFEFSRIRSGRGSFSFENNQAFGSLGETRPAIEWWGGTVSIP